MNWYASFQQYSTVVELVLNRKKLPKELETNFPLKGSIKSFLATKNNGHPLLFNDNAIFPEELQLKEKESVKGSQIIRDIFITIDGGRRNCSRQNFCEYNIIVQLEHVQETRQHTVTVMDLSETDLKPFKQEDVITFLHQLGKRGREGERLVFPRVKNKTKIPASRAVAKNRREECSISSPSSNLQARNMYLTFEVIVVISSSKLLRMRTPRIVLHKWQYRNSMMEYDAMKEDGIQLHGIIVTHPDCDHIKKIKKQSRTP